MNGGREGGGGGGEKRRERERERKREREKREGEVKVQDKSFIQVFSLSSWYSESILNTSLSTLSTSLKIITQNSFILT